MLPKNCGQLLFNAVRETLETMAFAEVVPCSIKVGGEEFSQADDDFSVRNTSTTTSNAGWEIDTNNTDNSAIDNSIGGNSGSSSSNENLNNWGNPPINSNLSVENTEQSTNNSTDTWDSSDSWGSPDNGILNSSNQLSESSFITSNNIMSNAGSNAVSTDCQNANQSNIANQSNTEHIAAADTSGWENIYTDEQQKKSEGEWAPVNTVAPSRDPWGDSEAVAAAPAATMALKEADFDDMVKQFAPNEWCWACMKVNSPDIHSVWFIITKGLANVLARNMYAGEDFLLDNHLIRDLIAELTNVLGGKLMLLLEELGGKFTLTVPEIGFGLPELPDEGYENAVCKVVVDGEHPVIVALCFNPGGINATGNK